MEENTNTLNIINTTSANSLKSDSDPDKQEIDRLKKFKGCVNETVRDIVCKVTFERFNNIVSGLQVFQKRPTSAVQMYKMIKQNIEKKCMSDLDDMIAGAGFPAKFQQLSQIIEQNIPYVGEEAWRPTGNPKDDQRTERMIAKSELMEELEKRVLAKKAAVESLKVEVNTHREKARLVDAEITSMLEKVDTRCKEKTRKIRELQESIEMIRDEFHEDAVKEQNLCVMR